jgi:3-oxoacyl-[acyl-carrier protein] reductase
MVEMSMSDEVVMITGAGRGLGRSYALAFAGTGCAVAVCDIDFESAERVKNEIESEGGVACAVELDVANWSSVESAVAEIGGHVGAPTVLINNAARFADLAMRPFMEIPLDEWDAVLRVNTTGAFICVRAVAPGMIERGRGKIINISSSTIWIGRPGYLHYVTSKSALVGMTRALANELGAYGINVNAITPGATRTEIERTTMSEQRWAEVGRQTALGRHALPDDMVGAVMFLASPQSAFITGQVLNVDGGRSFP